MEEKMFCSKCGSENKDDAKFCSKCGNPLSVDALAKKSVHKKGPGIILPVILAVIALVTIIIVVVNAKTTIKLNDYLVLTAEGYSKVAKASVDLDWRAIEEKYGSELSFTEDAVNEAGGLLNLVTPMDFLKQYIIIDIDKSRDVANGDVINYTWRVDEDLTKYVNCKVKCEEGSFEVSGLPEVELYDVFGHLNVTFTGCAPNGRVEFDYDGELPFNGLFSLDKSTGLKNGDVVTVSIVDQEMTYYAQMYGMIPDKTENAYTVTGLDEYVLDYNELTTECIDKAKADARDKILSYVANDYSKSSSLTDLEYVGYVMETLKENAENATSYNNLYLIYSGIVSNSDGKFRNTKVYFPVKFVNIAKGSEISYQRIDGICGESYLDGSTYHTYGYTSPIQFVSREINQYGANYDLSFGDGFEKYSSCESIKSISEMSEEYRGKIKKEALELVQSYTASYEFNKASTLEYVGEGMLFSKEMGLDFECNNKYFVVFSATVTNNNGYFDPTVVYFPVEFSGIVKLANNEFMYVSDDGIIGESRFTNSFKKTKGYIDGHYMFSDLINKNVDSYTYEVTDGIKVFE